jgi:hypothetical protein
MTSWKRYRTSTVRLMTTGVLAMPIAIGVSGCKPIDEIHNAIYGDYHRLSPRAGGIDITIKRHATVAMAALFDACKNEKTDAICGTVVLRLARDQLDGKFGGGGLKGPARKVWNGNYSIYGYHPHLGKGFRDAEGDDLAEAIRNLRRRGHECLRVHWKPTGTNWTTSNDEGVAECSWGKPLET